MRFGFKKSQNNQLNNTLKRQAIGIDLGNDALRIVQLAGRSLNQIQLEKHVISAFAQNIVKNNRINDYEKLTEILQQSGKTFHYKGQNIITALPSNQAVFEITPLPDSEADDLDEFAEARLSRLLPHNDINYDHQLFASEHKNQPAEILLVAARQEDVDARIELFEAANIQLAYLDLECFAQANAFFYWQENDAPHLARAPFASVMIRDNSMQAMILCAGKIVYQQELAYGYQQFAELLQQHYFYSEQEAQIILQTASRSQDYTPQLHSYFARISQEIRRFLQFYHTNQHEFGEVQQIVLSGIGSREAGLCEYLSSEINIPAACVHPISCLPSAQHLPQHEAAALTIAFGLALRGLSE